jgi:uncharacterized protein YjiS (DUF1127 family)
MGYIFDVLVLAILVYGVYQTFFRTFRQNLSDLFAGILALAAGAGAFWLLSAHHNSLPALWPIKIALLFGPPLLITILVAGFFHHYVKRLGSDASPSSRWKSWPGNIALSLTVLLFYAFLFDVGLQLLKLAPQGESLIEQSIVLRLGQRIQTALFVGEDVEEPDQIDSGETSASNTETERKVVPPELLEQQNVALQALRKNLGDARAFLAEKTGSRRVIEYVEMVKALAELSDEEKVWLFETTPELQAIAENASIKAILQDEELLTAILDLSQGSGSLDDLQTLLEREAIQALSEDHELLRLLRQIRLPELLQKVRERRELKEPSDRRKTI